MQNRLVNHLFVSAFFLLVFVALLLGRAADDNSLFSWAWVFARVDAAPVYLLLSAGLVASYFLSAKEVPEALKTPLLAALSFAACLPFMSEPELIVDAARYFTQAKHLELYGAGYFLREWGGEIQAWTDLPLVPFLYGTVFRLFGESRTVVQLLNAALFSGAVVLTCRIGQRLWDRETGFAAGLMLLGMPYLPTQAPLMLVDVPTMFFLTLAVFSFLEALHGGAVRGAAAAAAIALAALSKYSAWVMLSVLGVALAVYAARGAGRVDRRVLLRGAAILLCGAALCAAALLLMSDVVSEQLRLLREYQVPGLGTWGESYVSTFLYQIHPVVTVSALASAAIAVRKRDWRYAIVCWLVLIVLAFNIKRIRYTLPAFPMLALMAGYGLRQLRRGDLRRFILYCTVSSSLVIAVFAYLPFAQGMSAANLKGAGAYLDSLEAGEIEVVAIPSRDPVVNHAVSVPLLDLHTRKKLFYDHRPGASPPAEEIERSSLRFTWEYRSPGYYRRTGAKTDAPVAVISDDAATVLPAPVSERLEGYRLSAEFLASEGVFQYGTVVRVYVRPQAASP